MESSKSQSKTSKDSIDQSSKKELKPRPMVACTLPDGTLVDMVYSTTTGASFAVAQGDKIFGLPELYVGQDGNLVMQEKDAVYKYVPSWILKDHVKKNFIHIASHQEEYGSMSDLYQEIRSHIKKYVVLEDPRFYDVAVGYVLMTWVYDRFNTVPYLRVVGDLGTGKSRFLDVIGKLCNRSLMASSISPAAIYRTLDQVEGTLVYDEADFKSSDMTDDIVKLLNSGNKKGAPVVKMEVSDDSIKTVTFRVFGPKILGSRRNWSDLALESRCITYKLFPLKKVDVSVHLPPSFDAETQMLRNKLLMFRLKNYHIIQETEDSLGGIEFPRLRQAVLALTSVLQVVDREALGIVLDFLGDYEKTLLDTVSTDSHADVLLSIAWLLEFDDIIRDSGKMYMESIKNKFNAMYYEDYAERETKEVRRDGSVMRIPGQVVSSRKIGSYVDRLGLAKARDGGGIYIPLGKEAPKIQKLVARFGLQDILTGFRADEEEARNNPNAFKEDKERPF
ncbi:MAG: hypothetical protein AAB355_01530 [Patescibacteria group bacterium]